MIPNGIWTSQKFLYDKTFRSLNMSLTRATVQEPTVSKSSVECLMLCVCLHTHECYTAIKMNEILPFVTTWVDLKAIMLSGISQNKQNQTHRNRAKGMIARGKGCSGMGKKGRGI